MRKLILVAFALLVVSSGTLAMAQTPEPSASPEASPAAGPPGTIRIILDEDAGPGKKPGDRARQTTYRITMPPNGVIEPHEHVGNVIWHIEQGQISFTVEDGQVWGQCADGCVDPAAAGTSELLPVGQAVTFEAGDTITWNDTITHSWENTGTGAAIIFATTLYDEGDITPQGCGGGCF